MDSIIYRKRNKFDKKELYLKKREISQFYDDKIIHTPSTYRKVVLKIIKFVKIVTLSDLYNLYLR